MFVIFSFNAARWSKILIACYIIFNKLHYQDMLVCLEKCLYFINNVTKNYKCIYSKINTFISQLYMKQAFFCGFSHDLLYTFLILIDYGNYITSFFAWLYPFSPIKLTHVCLNGKYTYINVAFTTIKGFMMTHRKLTLGIFFKYSR